MDGKEDGDEDGKEEEEVVEVKNGEASSAVRPRRGNA
jgi:hypothetical protein